MGQTAITIFSIIFFLLSAYVVYKGVVRRQPSHPELLKKPFPEEFRAIMQQRIRYYKNLSPVAKVEFEKRILLFLAKKNITGIDTEVTDEDRLFVAASAIIPMFALPYYGYPNVTEVLLYPSSFDDSFQTSPTVEHRNILGMVGSGFLNGEVILSKPDLERAFDGQRHTQNVGIHEFVHLIDKADGDIDGIPEILMEHSYSLAWLKEIKKEIARIEKGESNINPYALTNNAEFLAVASEYFFDDPEKMKNQQPDLYAYLATIFHQNPDSYRQTAK